MSDTSKSANDPTRALVSILNRLTPGNTTRSPTARYSSRCQRVRRVCECVCRVACYQQTLTFLGSLQAAFRRSVCQVQQGAHRLALSLPRRLQCPIAALCFNPANTRTHTDPPPLPQLIEGQVFEALGKKFHLSCFGPLSHLSIYGHVP